GSFSLGLRLTVGRPDCGGHPHLICGSPHFSRSGSEFCIVRLVGILGGCLGCLRRSCGLCTAGNDSPAKDSQYRHQSQKRFESLSGHCHPFPPVSRLSTSSPLHLALCKRGCCYVRLRRILQRTLEVCKTRGLSF